MDTAIDVLRNCSSNTTPTTSTGISPKIFRLPFDRPCVVLNTRGRNFDSISRLLVTQDKRSVKCFVQVVHDERLKTNHCTHHHFSQPGPCCLAQPFISSTYTGGSYNCGSDGSGSFVMLDLMTESNFKSLESLIRFRIRAALDADLTAFGSDFNKWAMYKDLSRFPVSLSYCCIDNSQRIVKLQEDWLCFCANVSHVTCFFVG